jgi:hypothetical protein
LYFFNIYHPPAVDSKQILITLNNNTSSNQNMTTSKRLRQSMLIHDKSFATSASAFIETPTTSSSQTAENHLNRLNQKESSQVNQRIDGFHHRTSKFIPDRFGMVTKNKHINANLTKTIVDERQNTCEDDWVLFNFIE